MIKMMGMREFLKVRRDILINQIREKTTYLEELRIKVSSLEKEVEQLRGALAEVLNTSQILDSDTTENDTKEDISDEEPNVSEG